MSVETIRNQPELTKYHQYIKKLGSVCIATEKLDKQIRLVRKQVGETIATKKEVDIRMLPAVETAWDILDSTDPMGEGIRMNDYYRLMARASFASELVLAQHVYTGDDIDARLELADGTAGIAAHIVNEALKLFDSVPSDDSDTQIQACGIINEFTTIGFANLAEDGTSITLPSSQYSDMFSKIDAVHYGSNSDKKKKRLHEAKYYRTNVQVKSGQRPAAGRSSSRNVNRRDDVAYIFSSDFSNIRTYAGSFPMSRLLVREMDGVEIFENQRMLLDEQSNNVIHCIRSQKNELNTTPL